MSESTDGGVLAIPGFGIAGYRSIRDVQYIGPLGKITVLAGPNNSGKSNVLRFVRDHYSQSVRFLAQGRPETFVWADGNDAPLGVGGESAAIAACRDLSDESVLQGLALLRRNPRVAGEDHEMGEERAQALVELLVVSDLGVNGALWRVWQRQQRGASPTDSGFDTALNELARSGSVDTSLQPYIGQLSSTIRTLLLPDVPPALGEDPVFIPAFRQIRDGGTQTWDGSGLIASLAELRDPDLGPDKSDKERRWESFVRFVRTVLENDSVDIRVPANKSRLIVTIDGRSLDVEDLGTGIHEVLILAAAATAAESRVFLVEEPEIHIHPLLQRRLLTYLSEETSNQYIVATHSAHLLDHESSAVFRVSLDGGWTRITGVRSNSQVIATARELGYRPSDLLQANSVVWVEGPSDRVYIRYWLSQVAPEFLEGVHYAIMFYGGSLGAHLSGADSDFGLGADELVELRRLNRFSAIVMDSDREKKGQRISRTTTKGRLRTEFEQGSGVAWITQGREVENYISADTVLQAIQSLDHKAAKLIELDDFGRRWRYRRRSSAKHYEAKKVALARAIVTLDPSLDVLDLKKRLAEIVSMIREANE